MQEVFPIEKNEAYRFQTVPANASGLAFDSARIPFSDLPEPCVLDRSEFTESFYEIRRRAGDGLRGYVPFDGG